MKLKLESLVVTSFDTTAGADAAAPFGTESPVCPTPNTACFVCDPTVHNCA
jgi:hypothetical protein